MEPSRDVGCQNSIEELSKNNSRKTNDNFHRREYRSQSVASPDPRSPYFTHRWIQTSPKSRQNSHLHTCCKNEEKKKSVMKGSIPGLNLSPNNPKTATIRQHYYPEGGWGWIVLCCALIVHILGNTVILSSGFFIVEIRNHFMQGQKSIEPVLTAVTSTGVSYVFSPLVIALCKKKSTRLLAMFGGILTSLGCLFTSFATQLHQVYFSYGLMIGAGDCLTRETSSIILGEYFKRKRHQIQMLYHMGYGIGVATMPLLFSHCLRYMGWRQGLQVLAGLQTIIIVTAIFFRPASLYHPQRRAILHVKSLQRRSKVKDKAPVVERHRLLDFSVLKSKTVRILILGSGIIAFGITSPFVLMIEEMKNDELDLKSMYYLQLYLGVAISLGTAAFGIIVIKNSDQCNIAKQYLCQASAFAISGWLVAYPTLSNFYGYLLFVWIYGIFYGGYIYSLKLCVFEKVRARNYANTWGFLIGYQALPSSLGLPVIYYINEELGSKRGYYVAAIFVFIGSMSLFLIDIYKKKQKRKKEAALNAENLLQKVINQRKLSQETIHSLAPPIHYGDLRKAQELTCISEEILVDNFMEDYIEDCITSCNKEEKFLMLSEFENNVINSDERGFQSQLESSDSDALFYCEKYPPPFLLPRNPVKAVDNIEVIEEVTSSV